MNLTLHPSAADFLTAAGPTLEQAEATNNLMLGLANRLTANPHFYSEADPLLATVEDGGELLLAALRTPPFPLVIFSPHPDPAEAIKTLVRHLADAGESLPGVNGPVPLSENFARRWARRAGVGYEIEMRERVYEIRQVVPPHGVPGFMRQPRPEELDLIAEWYYAFNLEALGEDDRPSTRVVAERAVANGNLFVWDVDGQVVSMAGTGRRTPHGMSVGPVYTPPELRGHGYASAVTAALSQRILDQGHQFAALFTNLDYPTSNKIYMQIGYVPLADYALYRFPRHA
jgi:predicted GNAT family acetyltransferase